MAHRGFSATRELLLFLSFISAIVLYAADSDPAYAETPPPRTLNTYALDDDIGDFAVQLETDGAGNWVAVWRTRESGGGDEDVAYAWSSNDGNTWSAPGFINPNAGSDDGVTDADARLATDKQGNWVVVWATWENFGGAPAQIYAARSTTNGSTWSAPILLSTLPVQADVFDTVPELAASASGEFVVVWESDDPVGGESDIFFVRSADGGSSWSTPVAVNPGASTDIRYESDPDIATDGSGTWIVSWFSAEFMGLGVPPNVYVTRSVDGGSSWSTPAQFYPAGSDPFTGAPSLFASGDTWLAIWSSYHGTSDADLLYSRSTDDGASWSAPAFLNSNALSDSLASHDGGPTVVTSGTGAWVAIWQVGGTNPDMLIARSSDDGITWTTPQDAITPPTFDSYRPSLAVDSTGRGLLAWSSSELGRGVPYADQDILYVRCFWFANDCDSDSVSDDLDLCPETPSGQPVDATGCSDEDVDPDGDGLCSPDAPSAGPSGCIDVDSCPNLSGSSDGCPPPGPPLAVGGIAGLLDSADHAPAATTASYNDTVAHLAALAATIGAALIAGGWYARRRFPR